MYSKESLKKVVDQLDDLISFYKRLDPDHIRESISAGNRKIGRVLNVSLAPVITCANCGECCKLCYDIKADLQYFNVRDARARNTVLAMYHREEYFRRIREKCARRRRNKFFRWHVAGDILDLEYFAEMVNIAREFPDFKFWTYTKAYFIVNEYCRRYGRESIPENLKVMFSKWDGMPMLNPYNFPEFACKLKDGNKDTTPEEFGKMYKCPGNCDICKAACRGCIAGENTFADEH